MRRRQGMAAALVFVVCGVIGAGGADSRAGTEGRPAPEYGIYAGNTHAHTSHTWSHGVQWDRTRAAGAEAEKTGLVVTPDGVSHPPANVVLKHDWQRLQGPPPAHFAAARSSGYDFYAVTDHSQEADFHPTSPKNSAWLATKREADEATDGGFVALAGFEYSENDSPNGKGHLNVFNSSEYLNALEGGVDLPYLYQWIGQARPNGAGPVVASFNHPSAHSYGDWGFRGAAVTDVITMLEVVNSNRYRQAHYDGFVNALDKGWKVSPVAGIDNHGLGGVQQAGSRTFVLATARTKTAILDAMKSRRTYAALDRNIQCRYTVNGAVMGSTLDRPGAFAFRIRIDDPDQDKEGDRIVRIDIVKDGGVVVQTHQPKAAHSVEWSPSITDSTARYFFVRVWNAGGGDTPEPNPAEPVAWLAPVWTGR